jgi:hypothetical protein
MRIAVFMIVTLVGLSACSDDSNPGNGPVDEDSGASDAARDISDADDVGVDGGPDTSPVGDTGSDTADAPDASGDGPLGCAPLPDSNETIVRVSPSQAADLPTIVREASSGTTILLEDGTFKPGAPLQFRQSGVTLRSASNDATKVVIDGEYSVTEPVFIVASDVTVAHVTITRAIDHLVHVSPRGEATENVTGTLLYGLRLIDGGEQFVKVNPNGDRTAFVDDGRVECSFFEMTDDGRPHVERNPGGCYTGGIDNHSSQGWVVRNNEFRDIYCAGEGLAEHAVHFWSASRDTLVENNTIINCARGIGFGLGESGGDRDYADDPYPNAGYIGHYDGIIRNNVIYADNQWFDTGMELAQARGAKVYHNTVFSTDEATGFYSSIDHRFANTDVDIRNNLVDRITRRNDANGQVEDNLEGIGPELFVDAASLDFHLAEGASAAIDQGVEVDEAGVDIDGQPHDRGAAPDLGADER